MRTVAITLIIFYHKKKMGEWKLSVFRPERKRDTGEFIPIEISKNVLESKTHE